MSRLRVQPTKSNLLRLEEELDFAQTGHGLLEEKREILLARIRDLITQLRAAQEQLYAEITRGHELLARAAVSLGWRRLDTVHVRPEGPVDVAVEPRHYMGLELPHYTLAPRAPEPHYSPSGTNAALDDAQAAFVRLLPLIVAYAEIEAHLYSLSTALKKTMKRVNALENIFIPDFRDTVGYVTDTLEELDREEMYIQKLVKAGRQAAPHPEEP